MRNFQRSPKADKNHNLVLFAGMAPGDGVSHVTIGNLVLLNMPILEEASCETYTWIVPQVEGKFPK
ncbi:hypothetical protein [Dendronalium sp. ChiSLP03b]|uniref:hypothetical protein n=1 Tax=Dendronalium sp. ChiSLP03b TaxID=3075381 RepID=UPI002AD4B4A1|nr:hypothetical protein [Dendronalium sp. ChiSLP03b]MDZ8207143.1 hypothetical protein [Dendronalium sp. ChiSLP03b]